MEELHLINKRLRDYLNKRKSMSTRLNHTRFRNDLCNHWDLDYLSLEELEDALLAKNIVTTKKIVGEKSKEDWVQLALFFEPTIDVFKEEAKLCHLVIKWHLQPNRFSQQRHEQYQKAAVAREVKEYTIWKRFFSSVHFYQGNKVLTSPDPEKIIVNQRR